MIYEMVVYSQVIMLNTLFTTFGSEPSQQLNMVFDLVPAGWPWTLTRNSHLNGHTFSGVINRLFWVDPLGHPLTGAAVGFAVAGRTVGEGGGIVDRTGGKVSGLTVGAPVGRTGGNGLVDGLTDG